MCGIFGIYGHKNAAELSYLGLFALQHRGQESAGIVSSDGLNIYDRVRMGLVSEIFNGKKLAKLKGHMSSGHVRYSTKGGSNLKNAQPFVLKTGKGMITIAHNGNLINTDDISKKLENNGAIFQSETDSERIVHLIARSKERDLTDSIVDALKQVEGSYSLIITTEKDMYAIRDPYGIRPLSLGNVDGAYAIASETSALDLIGANYIRDIEPGEILKISEKCVESIKPFEAKEPHPCIFELIYFARPDSYVFGVSVSEARKNMGQELAKYDKENNKNINADFVGPVPDSGMYGAIGYSKESSIEFDLPFTRNHYIGRTFIKPQQSTRDFSVKIKLSPVKEVIKGKRIVLVEDSIVRGTTSKDKIKNLREKGAKEVHMRVYSPLLKYPCFYGLDIPTKMELIAHHYGVDEICKIINADSLVYQSIEGLLNSVPQGTKYCHACMSGDYPISRLDIKN